MTDREATIGLNMVPLVGPVRLRRLIGRFGSACAILRASADSLMQVDGIGDATARGIRALTPALVDDEIGAAARCGARIVLDGDPDYPPCLHALHDPPSVLYVRGTLPAAGTRALAVVGTRQPTLYGKRCAGSFSSWFAERGITVVSGLARGIDTCAHTGALAVSGTSVAVLGCGVGMAYPPENKPLADALCSRGAVVSEFPVKALPLKQHFPRRNRLISGLSEAVLVVEAGPSSGALITADFALEQGKDIFCVPGMVDTPAACGVHTLIREGARLVTSPQEVLEELGWDAVSRMPCGELGAEEAAILDHLGPQPVHFDALASKTTVDISRISAILLTLQLKGLVRQLPGQWYVRGSQ